MERKLQDSSRVYFVRELLTLSLDGRRVDLLTFTSFKGLTFDREPLVEGLFPTAHSIDQRPYKSMKPTIFLTARVHPGEVPGSHLMNGMLDFLSDEDCPEA